MHYATKINLNFFYMVSYLQSVSCYFAVPGIESQKFGVHQYESVQNFFSSSLHTVVDLLHHTTFQKLNTLFAKGRVDQPLHSLNRSRKLFIYVLKTKTCTQLRQKNAHTSTKKLWSCSRNRLYVSKSPLSFCHRRFLCTVS